MNIVLATILGSSPSTKYQIKKYLEENGITDKEDLISWYVKYSTVYGIQSDVAIAISLLYTDFFKKSIIGNNICGIGYQFGLNSLEKFDTIESCIIAQYEILRSGADFQFVSENPHSYTYNYYIKNFAYGSGKTNQAGSIVTLSDVYENWNICGEKYGSPTYEDFWIIVRNIPLMREEKPSYENTRDIYFFALVMTSKSINDLIKHKANLKKLGFDDINIIVDKGFYRLEIGNFKNEKDTLIVVNNLQLFGYNGTIEHRKKR